MEGVELHPRPNALGHQVFDAGEVAMAMVRRRRASRVPREVRPSRIGLLAARSASDARQRESDDDDEEHEAWFASVMAAQRAEEAARERGGVPKPKPEPEPEPEPGEDELSRVAILVASCTEDELASLPPETLENLMAVFL